MNQLHLPHVKASCCLGLFFPQNGGPPAEGLGIYGLSSPNSIDWWGPLERQTYRQGALPRVQQRPFMHRHPRRVESSRPRRVTSARCNGATTVKERVWAMRSLARAPVLV